MTEQYIKIGFSWACQQAAPQGSKPMSQKRWIVEIAFTDPWRGKPADNDWRPDDAMAGDWRDKRLATERAAQIGESYNCFTRVRRTDQSTAPLCHWPTMPSDWL